MNSYPVSSGGTEMPGAPLDDPGALEDPIYVPEELAQGDAPALAGLGNETVPFDPPVLVSIQSDAIDDPGTQITQVPEPATLSLLALAILGLGWNRRRRAEGSNQ